MTTPILILSCRKQGFADRRQGCRDTWLASLPRDKFPYRFIVGDRPDASCWASVDSAPNEVEEAEGQQDILHVDSEDHYQALPGKVTAALEVFVTQLFPGCKGVWKCDDDSWFNPDAFPQFEVGNFDVIGRFAGNRFPLGCGYYLNRRTIDHVLAKKPKIVYGPEDVLIGGRAALVPEGKCMDDARINPVSRVHEDRWAKGANTWLIGHGFKNSEQMKEFHSCFLHVKAHNAVPRLLPLAAAAFPAELAASATAVLPNNYVTVRLQGGLGNRFSQIASAAGVAETLKRPFGLQIDSVLASLRENPHSVNSYLKTLFRQIPWFAAGASGLLPREFHEGPNKHTEAFPIASIAHEDIPLSLNGYFQHGGNFNHIRPLLLSWWQEPLVKIGQAAEQKQVNMAEVEYFLHVRRGDYTKPPFNSVHDVDLRLFYKRALDCIVMNHPKQQVQVLVFSDDPDAARRYLFDVMRTFDLDEVDFLHQPRCANELEDMGRMMLCKNGGILANSTFGWWAAYLAPDNGSKRFYVPDQFLLDRTIDTTCFATTLPNGILVPVNPIDLHTIHIGRPASRWDTIQKDFASLDSIIGFPTVTLRLFPGVDAGAAVGCYTSHLLCLEEAEAKGIKWILQGEDDAYPLVKGFVKTFHPVLIWAINHLADWDVINFGPSSFGPDASKRLIARPTKEANAPRCLYQMNNFTCTTLQLFNVNTILPCLRQAIAGRDPIVHAPDIDEYLGNLSHLKKFFCYPLAAWQRPGISLITGRLDYHDDLLKMMQTVEEEVRKL